MIVTAHGRAAVGLSDSQGFVRNRTQQAVGWVDLEEGRRARRETKPQGSIWQTSCSLVPLNTSVCICTSVYVWVCIYVHVCVCLYRPEDQPQVPVTFSKKVLLLVGACQVS